jgi:hypothetical protein
MNSIIFKSVGIAAIIAIVGTAAHAGNYKRVKKQDQFLELVNGKTILGSGGQVTINADGTSTGKFEPGAYSAKWEWKGKYMCRSGKLGDREIPYDCQKVEYDGEKMRFTRNKGKGKASEWTFK